MLKTIKGLFKKAPKKTSESVSGVVRSIESDGFTFRTLDCGRIQQVQCEPEYFQAMKPGLWFKALVETQVLGTETDFNGIQYPVLKRDLKSIQLF